MWINKPLAADYTTMMMINTRISVTDTWAQQRIAYKNSANITAITFTGPTFAAGSRISIYKRSNG
jgi:hypothetical protein